MSPVVSSIIAPSLDDIGRDLNIESESEKSLCLSILVLGFAFGPLVLAPLSEMYGRSIVLQGSNIFFVLFNTLCGFSRSKSQLIACRLLAGIGGSAPLALGPAMLADLFAAEERGLAAGIYSFMPIMGPAIAPICGSFITEYSTWRWGLWAVSIADIPVLLLGILFLEETYAPVLLRQKRKKLVKENCDARFYTLDDQKRQSFSCEMRQALVRPVKMMFTQVIVIVMGVYQAYMYGLMYIVLTTFPTLWREQYNESTSIGGLNYISLGLGYSLGILVCIVDSHLTFNHSVTLFRIASYDHPRTTS
jgi:multidrug resistance protein